MRPKIIAKPPGPKARAIIKSDEKLLMQSNWRYLPFVPKTGAGCYVEDVDGNVFLDLVSGAAVMNVGTGNKEVLEAILKQSNEIVYSAFQGCNFHEIVTEIHVYLL